MEQNNFIWPTKKPVYFYIKSFIDWLMAAILLFFLWWVILICVIAIKIDDASASPFYIAKRPGYREKPFTMYKLRTVKIESSNQRSVNDDMLTKPGRFIRKLSLDELPQLVNVLLGNMSFIGPRPLLLDYIPYYTDTERLRHSVRPGITGLAQINGRANLDWDTRFALDVEYATNLSLSGDLKILVQTVGKVLGKADVMNEDDKSNKLISFDDYRKQNQP